MDSPKQKRYSPEELKEFEKIILEKLEKTHYELKMIQKALSKVGANSIEIHSRPLEDNAETIEKEILSKMAERQQTFIKQLKGALLRIKNGTYGICENTGELIDKERLKVVPNTRYSIDSKLSKK